MKTTEHCQPDIMKKESMKLFTMLCGYFLLVVLIYSLCQFINFRNCLGIVQILAILLPVIFYVYLEKNDKNFKKSLFTIVIYLALLIILPFLYNKTFDLTYDGNSYHKTAIAFLKNGWNPLYETSKEFQKNNNHVVKFAAEDRIDLWIEHYPKATWIIAATIYNMTGNIESGKCITLIFSLMLFLISFNCLRKILDKNWSLLISSLVVLNPITLAQFFTYYVDGIMVILFTIELLLLFLVNPKEKINKSIWFSLTSICVIFVNLKFTGLLCSGVIAATFYFYWLASERNNPKFFEIFKRVTLSFTVIFTLAIFVVGANSYVKNTFDHLNPLYPIIGKDKVDIITTMQPQEFAHKGMLEKFTISLFSRSENILADGRKPILKLPIKVYRSEIMELFAPDVRIAGFGPLFALFLILSTIFFIYLMIVLIKNKSIKLKYLILPTIAIFISSLLVGENWWARYVPQLYLLPIGTLLLACYLLKETKQKKLKFSILIVSLVAFLNLSCFFYVNAKKLIYFNEIDKDLKAMSKVEDLTLKLSGKTRLYGYFYNLNDRNINYTIDENLTDSISMYKNKFEVKKNEKLSKTN